MEKSSGIKKEVDEDSQDTQDTLEEQTSKDDVDEDELVRKSAAELLQHFTDNLKARPKKSTRVLAEWLLFLSVDWSTYHPVDRLIYWLSIWLIGQ